MTEEFAHEFQTLWGRLGRGTKQQGDSLERLLWMFADEVGLEILESEEDGSWAYFKSAQPSDTDNRGTWAQLFFAVNDDDQSHAHEFYSTIARVVYEADVAWKPAPVFCVKVCDPLRSRLSSSPIPFVLLDLDEVGRILRARKPLDGLASALHDGTAADVDNPFQCWLCSRICG